MLDETWRFNTDAFPNDQRASAWQAALGKLRLESEWPSSRDAPGGGIFARKSISGAVFANLWSDAQSIRCARQTRSPANRDDVLTIALQVKGTSALTGAGKHVGLEPGDVAVLGTELDSCIDFEAEFHEFVAAIPRATLSSRLGASNSLGPSQRLDPNGLGAVLSDLLCSVAHQLEVLEQHELVPLEIAVTELLVTLVLDRADDVPGSTAVQTAHLHRVCRLIELRLGDPELSLSAIADHESLSPRYLQRLFEAGGSNFSEYVRERRLERCHSDLKNSKLAHNTITDLCFRWGFNDAAHFSRTFKERYGTSPRAYRRKAPIEVSTPLNRGRPLTSARAAESEVPLDLLGPEARGAGESGMAVKVDGDQTVSELDRLPISAHTGAKRHYLAARKQTVHWGYFSRSIAPVITVNSGDIVTIEALTHHAFDDFERMIKGDPGLESVYGWTAAIKSVEQRGAGPLDASIYGRGAGEGFGVHICTGPVFVRGAEPGDVLEVRILDVYPRPCANPLYLGRAFGSNAAAWWGFQYNDLLTEPKPREVATIYEIDAGGEQEWARAVYNFRWTPQTDPSGVAHPTIDYPGIPVDHSTIVENHGILRNAQVPVRPHFGVIAVAPKEAELVDSIPPSYFGGNLDNWRAGKGATMYLPISVPGALLSVGDPHASQGDGELCGTAIECSLNGVFQLVLRKKAALPGSFLSDVNYPLLETKDEWVIQGFSYANYLLELGEKAQSEVYNKSSLDRAMRDAFRKVRRFLMTTQNLSEDEAISLISVAVDFGVTQVANGNWGIHAVLKKCIFANA